MRETEKVRDERANRKKRSDYRKRECERLIELNGKTERKKGKEKERYRAKKKEKRGYKWRE